ncbi:MAG: hypothetical protein WD533_04000 [Dehalococcoidia bacterium]
MTVLIIIGIVMVAGFVLAVVAGIAVILLLGRASGWKNLAARYLSRRAFPGTLRKVSHANLNNGSYSNVLRIGASEAGLHLAAASLFKVSHPPLDIPWEEISMRAQQGAPGAAVHLDFGGNDASTLSIPLDAAVGLARDAEAWWEDGRKLLAAYPVVR